MSGHQTQIEKLSSENTELQEKNEELEKELEKREYHQGLKERHFWKRSPSFWFSVVESEFKVAGVTDDHTKYHYVVGQLDEDITKQVKDIIENPPLKGKYSKIKEELRRRLGEPEPERMRKLFEAKLENKSPSQFYRHLQWLAGANITVDKILLHLWLRRLPQYCQEILATRLEQTNAKLAELADNIFDATKASGDTKNNTVVDNIQQSVDELTKQVTALKSSVRHQQSRSRSRSTSKPRSENNTPAATPIKLCWYHTCWGADAYRCIQPCSWKKSDVKAEN